MCVTHHFQWHHRFRRLRSTLQWFSEIRACTCQRRDGRRIKFRRREFFRRCTPRLSDGVYLFFLLDIGFDVGVILGCLCAVVLGLTLAVAAADPPDEADDDDDEENGVDGYARVGARRE